MCESLVYVCIKGSADKSHFVLAHGVQWAACHNVTLRRPCCLLGSIMKAWSEVGIKWSDCLPGQVPLTLGRYC